MYCEQKSINYTTEEKKNTEVGTTVKIFSYSGNKIINTLNFFEAYYTV
jgi:hypothetical protein